MKDKTYYFGELVEYLLSKGFSIVGTTKELLPIGFDGQDYHIAYWEDDYLPNISCYSKAGLDRIIECRILIGGLND